MDNTSFKPGSNRAACAGLIFFGLIVFGLPGCGGGGGSSAPSLSISSPSVLEGDNGGTAELVFTVTLSENASSNFTANFNTSDGTATAGEDYTAVINDQLAIPAGSNTASVSVFAIGDDIFENNESFNLEITNPQGITLAANSFSGFGTIENDDNVDAGYFTGTATLGGTPYEDITAMMYSNRILMFSPGVNVLYDITVNGSSSFTATVDVYEDGLKTQTVNITGGVIDGFQITGTLDGVTGFGTGSFDILFDVDNNEGASLGRIEGSGFDSWNGDFFGIEVDTAYFAASNGDYISLDDTDNLCHFTSQFPALEASINIYPMEHDVVKAAFDPCPLPYLSTGHTGFASVVNDTGIDDKLVFAFTNGEVALFSIMYK